MNTTITDKPGESRYEIRYDGARAGFAEYRLHGGVVAFIHTEISPQFGGRGLATELIRAALDSARTRSLQVEPFCPFVRRFIAKHPDYRDLVPSAEWERFGLG